MGKRPDLAKGARIFAIVSDPAFTDRETSQTFLKETGYPGKLLLDQGARVTLEYQSAECPRIWVLDDNGIARHLTPDPSAPAAKIVDDAVAALSKPAAPSAPSHPSIPSRGRSAPNH